MFTRNCELKRSRLFLSFLVLCLAFDLHSPSSARGDKWQIMTFSENLEQDLAAFNEFCFLHDLASEDVLWANNCTAEDLVPGVQLRLPVSHVDLLSLWQNRGAWQPKALIPVTSAALAERARTGNKSSGQSEKNGAQPAQPPVATPSVASTVVSTPAPVVTLQPTQGAVKPKPMPAVRETPAEAIARTTARQDSSTSTVALKTATPAPIPVKSATATAPASDTKINPVLILRPNGDNNAGPMRLVVAGDHVEVVRLPKEAAPKTPSLADLNQPLGTSMLFDIMNSGSSSSTRPELNIPAGAKMMWPVSGKISSGFGIRSGRKHDGLDLPMPLGTEIHAALDGRVLLTGTNSTPGFRGYGNFVLLEHGHNICTLYTHCESVGVKKDQYVRKGQVIATVGQTGRASTTHVHFEVRVNGKAVDPKPYLASR